MSLNKQVIKAIAWLGAFKVISQAFSWTTTVFVARILTARDYGLMEMATIFTGYIQFFVEFGLSAAIINKTELTENDSNSIFWFLLFWGMILGSTCLIIAPMTAWYFNNDSLIPITSSVGILFIVSSAIILPRSLLHRDLKFKEVGAIDAISVFVACFVMLFLVNSGAGVWTLLIGTISKEFARMLILYCVVDYRPKFHFSYDEIKPIIKFGFPVVVSDSLFYIYNKSDRFFGGKALGDQALGFYAIALQLAAMPVEKILSIFQSAIFPAFSKLKNDKEEFNKLFLKFSNAIYTFILPIFVGGFMVAEIIIPALLGEKWRNSIMPFKYLVIAQLFVSICSPLNIIHTSRGLPRITLKANMILCPLMFFSFYFSSKLGDPALLAIPWITIYPLFTLCYLAITLKSLNISYYDYLLSIIHPILAISLMTISIYIYKHFFLGTTDNIINLITIIFIGVLVYSLYIFKFCRDNFFELKNQFRRDTQ